MQRLGLQCVSCGEHASYYALVRSMGKCMVWALTRDGVPFTLDHHMPRALGGSNRSSNLRVMCDVCNQKKGCAHPEQ
ncbi:MAG: HNH endonuclease [Armatimonadetes bacterium]|nr:HNH endonuclease [Armatimonadota bacterium]